MSAEQQSPHRSPWMRTADAAVYIRVQPSTLAKWRVRGNGPPFHKPSGQRFVLYHRDELDAWLRAGLHTNTSEEG